MARTKASVGAKIASGKSSKAKSNAPSVPSTSYSGGEKSSRSGGNPVCPRDTPRWQRAITTFFVNKRPQENGDSGDDASAGSSKSKPKRNIIQSSDEEDSPSPPKNQELDETIELPPLVGDHSHKIEEYYTTNGVKGKGVGKKTKGKENVNCNVVKRGRDDDDDDGDASVSKKVKV